MPRYNPDNPGQISIINNPANHGLSTVWLLATLGSKSNKRILKRDINFISISRTCDVIDESKSSLTLRVTSNLLHGVSLLYKLQVDYLWGDVQLINGRLQRNTHMSDMIYNRNLKAVYGQSTTSIFTETRIDQQQQILEDDCRFLIEEEFALGFEEVEILRKQHDYRYHRMIELQLQDKKNNYSFEMSNNLMEPSTFQQNHDSTITDLGNIFGIEDENSFDSIDIYGHQSINDYDLEFESDNEERKGEKQRGDTVVEDNDLELDFTLADLEDVDPDILEGGIDNRIGEFSDPLFDLHFTTTTNESGNNNETTGLNREQSTVIKVGVNKRRKIQTDESIRFSSVEMKHFTSDYNEAMIMATMQRNNLQPNKVESLSDILRVGSNSTPKFLNLAYKHVFGLQATRNIPTHRLPLKRGRMGGYGMEQINSLIEAADELEVGRHAIPPFETGVDEFNQSMQRGINEGYDEFSLNQAEIPELMDIPELTQDPRESYDFMEESIDYTPGANHVPTQRVVVGELNLNLKAFVIFLMKRIDLQGVNSQEKRELFDLHRLENENNEEQVEVGIRCIRFDQLMPTKRNQPCASRTQAVRAFSSMLELITRNFALVELQEVQLTELMDVSDIKIYCLC